MFWISRPSWVRSACTTTGSISRRTVAPVSAIAAERSLSVELDLGAQVERLDVGFRAADAREDQQVVDHFPGAHGGRRDDGGRALGGGRVRRLHGLLDQTRIDGDLAQGLLKVVRGDIGELGQALVGELEVARVLGEVQLRLAPRRDVDDGREHERAGRRVDRVRPISTGNSTPSLRVPCRSRPAPIGRLVGGREEALPQPGVRCAGPFGNQDVDRAAHEIVD